MNIRKHQIKHRNQHDDRGGGGAYFAFRVHVQIAESIEISTFEY